MRLIASLGLGIILISVAVQSLSNEPKSVSNRTDSADLAAIRQTSLDFETAFNDGKASAVAARWTEDGDYVAETGQVFSGRKAIENEYQKFFTAHKEVLHCA